MQESILSRLDASRKELLDLGLRNPLLNYRQLASKGLHIVQEQSSFVYDILVNQGKAMSFQSVPEKAGNKDGLAVLSEAETKEFLSDTKLQTTETEATLQHKLLNTYYAARTSIEEQGVNTLFLSLGMLHWFESENSQEERRAPLVLIPVSLERSSARERFRVKYTLEEIGENLSLQAKMKAEFGMMLPDLPDEDDFSLNAYFQRVAEGISHFKRWKVAPNAIELGFFSFGKFMIYNDLDNSKWPQDQKPVEHPLIQSLFQNGFQEPAPSAAEDAFIDTETQAGELFQVVDADSSQILAMLAVQEGRNLVIQGPPGTGKSQTITNLIANAIGQGKKVLFVAEKMAALEVVKRRLDSANLGDACLELHSHKANKKELHHELKRVLELGKPAIYQLQQEVALLEKHKDELNAYSIAVNTLIGKSGLTPHRIMGYLLQLYETIDNSVLPKILLPEIEQWDAQRMQQAGALAERIQVRLNDIGVPAQLLFWGTGLKVLLPQEQENLLQLIQKAFATSQALFSESALIAQAFGVPVPANREESIHLASLAQLASAKPDLREMNIASNNWLLRQNDIQELLHTGKRLHELHLAYEQIFIPEAWDQQVLEIRQELVANGNKWYRFLIGSYNKAIKQLKAICKTTLPKENGKKLQYVDDLLEAKRLTTVLKEYEELATELYGRCWQGAKSDWEALTAASGYLSSVHQYVADKVYPSEIILYLNKQEVAAIAREFHLSLLDKLSEQGRSIQVLTDKLKLDEGSRFAGKTFLHQPFAQQMLLLDNWIKGINEIHQAISWNNLVETALEEDLQVLTNAATHWKEAKDFLKINLQKTWYEYLLQQAVNSNTALRKFERATHEEVISQFKKLDALNFQYNQARAALKHWDAMPRMEAGGQMTILRTEFNKKARHLPIRKLVQEAGLAIQAVKPVFMMSPLSIANFLPPGALDFDLVIFDEASQVRPVDALGAILRGRQLVVVGDNKQLPPSSFFDTLNTDFEEEENITADMQSILGLCDAQGAPQRMLRWHYRSRHESLISLSNHEFYENKLVVFPSPGSKHHLGLVFHHLKETAYDRGNSRTNQKEAEIVAEAVMEHARRHPKLSLGVVAFSTAQRQAIQDSLEMKRRKNADAETFFKSHVHEPFFIKNLENVQGDERDVIFISVGYGRTEEGFVSMSFGPLNNEGGERRLNVLITRAKLRCEVFTNLTADDIDSSRSKAYGVKALKNFLQYAQKGVLGLAEETGRPSESPFEEAVAQNLIRLGYIVRKQVGSKGFYLDLAIVDPENPGRYVLGIECDGAAYHSARSARDRDRLRQQVLEGIGWRIHRIWSTDWFRNPERELKRVKEAINKAWQLTLTEPDEVEEIEEITWKREEVKENSTELPPYQMAILPQEITDQEIHLQPIGKLAAWLEGVVEVESPVHFDEVARRIVEAAGITRIGPRIREHIKLAARFAQGSGRIQQKGDFLWRSETEVPVLRNRSELPAGTRKLKYIAPEEISLAVQKVVHNSIAISPEAVVPFVARLFGFPRVTEDMRNDILEVIQQNIQQGIFEQEGEFLKIKKT